MSEEHRALLMAQKSQEAMNLWWKCFVAEFPGLAQQGNSPWCHAKHWQDFMKHHGQLNLRAGFDRRGGRTPEAALDIEKDLKTRS